MTYKLENIELFGRLGELARLASGRAACKLEKTQ
jgi:hypothetical protein